MYRHEIPDIWYWLDEKKEKGLGLKSIGLLRNTIKKENKRVT